MRGLSIKIVKWVRAFVVGVWCLLCVILFTAAIEPHTLLGLPLWCLALVVTIFIHEAGHALGAWIMGWRVVVFAVWRIAFHLPQRKFAILPDEALDEASGWVASVPSGPRVNTRQRYAVIIASGPFASFLQAVMAISIAALAPFEPGFVKTEPLLLGMALLGFGVFVSSAVPSRAENDHNDARMLLENYRAIHERRPLYAMAWALALLNVRVRLKDLPAWLLDEDEPQLRTDSGYLRWRAGVETGRTLDSEPVDAARARAQIDRLRSEFEDSDWLRACDAFLAAVHERDLARARSMIDALANPDEVPQMQAAARAAAGQLAGDRAAATGWLDQMDAVVAAKSPFRDLTFAEIRARVEGLPPLAAEPRALQDSAASA